MISFIPRRSHLNLRTVENSSNNKNTWQNTGLPIRADSSDNVVFMLTRSRLYVRTVANDSDKNINDAFTRSKINFEKHRVPNRLSREGGNGFTPWLSDRSPQKFCSSPKIRIEDLNLNSYSKSKFIRLNHG